MFSFTCSRIRSFLPASGRSTNVIAVSQGDDPTGAWHRYQFMMSQNKLNDYPKFGVWSDSYSMSFNQFQCSVITCSWCGHGIAIVGILPIFCVGISSTVTGPLRPCIQLGAATRGIPAAQV